MGLRRACSVLILGLSISPSLHAAPLFSDATDKFPPPRCGTGADQGCYTSALVVADVDGDGKIDVVFANGGGYYEPGTAEPAVVLFNEGASFVDGTDTSFKGLTSRVRQVAVGDVDGDGDLDVFLPGGYGLDADRLLIQTGPRTFEDQASTRLPFGQKSRAGAAHLGDLDNDGDLDLVVTDWGTQPLSSPGDVALFLNDGQGFFAKIKDRIPAPLPAAQGSTPIDIDLQDVDGDLDLDVLVNHRNGQSRLLLNDGHATFSEAAFPPKNGPYAYNTEACDIDGDGDLDVLLDNAAGDLDNEHRTQVLINDGKGMFSDESAARISKEPNTDDNIVKCADIDDDGDFDLIIGSLQNPSEKLLQNDGAGVFSPIENAFPETSDPTLGLDVADLDGDGILDVVTGQGEGQPRVDRLFLGINPSKADTHPPRFRQIEALPAALPSNQPIILRLAVTDAHTSEVGQHASVVVAYSTQDSSGEIPARFMGGDLFRADLGAFPGGTTLTLTPRATDRTGHTAEASPLSISVTGQAGAGGAAGSGGGNEQGGQSGAGSSGTSGQGGTTDQGGAGGEPAGAGGSPSPSSAAPEQDDGCGCAEAGTPRGSKGWAALLALLAASLRLKKRSSRQA